MLFSIVTVCYNAPRLEETCLSILNQISNDFEWIVIDGGSAPEYQRIFEKYKHKMSHFVSEKDNGIYHAMNKGITLAKGTYCIFMNASDSFAHNAVLLETAHFISTQQIASDILYGDILVNGTKFETQPSSLSAYDFCYGALNHQAAFIKTELFAKYGQYDMNFPISSDFERFTLFYKKDCSFTHMPITVANYYMDGFSSKQNYQLPLMQERERIRDLYFSKEEQIIASKNKPSFFKSISQKIKHLANGIFHVRKVHRNLEYYKLKSESLQKEFNLLVESARGLE